MKQLSSHFAPIASFVLITFPALVYADADAGCTLTLDGAEPIYFDQCTGMGSENDVIEQKVIGPGGVEIVKKLPGQLRWDDIILRRSIADTSMATWRQEIEEGNILTARSNGSLVMYDEKGDVVSTWNFMNAWPSKVTNAGAASQDKTTDAKAVALEEVTLVLEYIERVD